MLKEMDEDLAPASAPVTPAANPSSRNPFRE